VRHNPWKIVEMFEENMAEYCNSPYAVAVDSCTNAILLCCQYLKVKEVTIPHRTYLSVPQSIINAGGTLSFRECEWEGIYQLEPYPIFDAAKRLTQGMYIPDTYMCLSFHHKKILKIGKGGMILTDNEKAAKWLKKSRYEGRDHVHDDIDICGWNAYMTPEEAARGLTLLQTLPKINQDQDEKPPYRDLRTMPLFEGTKTVSR
jgi:dTDP-4-amino-4,6-dideoxygalactose transaminase